MSEKVNSITKEDFVKSYYELRNTPNCLPMITVTTGTKDFNDSYVARIFTVMKGQTQATEIFAVASSLELIRDFIPSECGLLGRSECDDPVIVESWL